MSVSNNASEVIKFPKTPKPRPEVAKPVPWWQNNSSWILNLAKKHPEIDDLINDHARLFLHKMAVWRHPPTQGQTEWLDKIADWVEDTMKAIRAIEAEDEAPPQPTPPPDVA
jgi:hypothetical protein